MAFLFAGDLGNAVDEKLSRFLIRREHPRGVEPGQRDERPSSDEPFDDRERKDSCDPARIPRHEVTGPVPEAFSQDRRPLRAMAEEPAAGGDEAVPFLLASGGELLDRHSMISRML